MTNLLINPILIGEWEQMLSFVWKNTSVWQNMITRKFSSLCFVFHLSCPSIISAYSYRFEVLNTPIPLRNSKVAVNLTCSGLVISLVNVVLPMLYKQHHIENFLASSYCQSKRPISILCVEIIYLNALFPNFSKENPFSSLRVFLLWNSKNSIVVQDLFLLKFNKHLMTYQRTSYSEVIASLWLSLRLKVCLTLSIPL